MKNNHKIGLILSALGITAGLLAFYLITSQYNQVIGVKLAADRLDKATSGPHHVRLLGWLGTASTAIWAAVF